MPKPVKRRELIRRLRLLGFEGPFPGKRHEHMRNGTLTIAIPNPHRGDIDWSLIKLILKQARLNPKDFEDLA
jgi:predicted RNA binding protein YcfA (HicA-like mRNA interferase family)